MKLEVKNLNELADFLDKMAKYYYDSSKNPLLTKQEEWGFFSQHLAFDKASEVVRNTTITGEIK